MTASCRDLQEALRTRDPERIAAIEAHAGSCTRCAEQLRLWHAISEAAPSLRKEWESPRLWPRIRERLAEDGRGQLLRGDIHHDPLAELQRVQVREIAVEGELVVRAAVGVVEDGARDAAAGFLAKIFDAVGDHGEVWGHS